MLYRLLVSAFAFLLIVSTGRAQVGAPLVSETQAEIASLRQRFADEVRHGLSTDPGTESRWVELARAELDAAGEVIDHPQLLVVVDRNPAVQSVMLVAAQPSDDWSIIGGTHVSTGQRGRFDHYITPRGVFHLTTAILGYRAEGTLNENGIRGLGAKGMRVWDFGWHVAMKGWKDGPDKPDRTAIRLMLHATDPDRLEQRLGRPASQGCVRVPARLNRFLDRYGVLDSDYERAAVSDIRFRSLLLPDRQPSKLAGNTLVVIDSAGPPAALHAGL